MMSPTVEQAMQKHVSLYFPSSLLVSGPLICKDIKADLKPVAPGIVFHALGMLRPAPQYLPSNLWVQFQLKQTH